MKMLTLEPSMKMVFFTLYIQVHHLRDGANACNWKLASLGETVICKRPELSGHTRPSWANFFFIVLSAPFFSFQRSE